MILALHGILSNQGSSGPAVTEFRTSSYSNSAALTWAAIIASTEPHVRFINDSVAELDLHYGDAYEALPNYDIYVEWALEGGTAYYHNFVFHDSTVPAHSITFEYLSAGACPNTIMVEYKADDIPLTLIGQPGMESGGGITTIAGLRSPAYGSDTNNVFSPLTITNLAVTTIYGQGYGGTSHNAGTDGSSANGADGVAGADSGSPGVNANPGSPGDAPITNGTDATSGDAGDHGTGKPSVITLNNSHVTNLYIYSSSGGNGSPGGNGGSANGGNGGNGGNGYFDSYANMPSQGGDGGPGGTGGTGGSGGSGGNGGNAYNTGSTVYGVFNNSVIDYLYRRASGGIGGAKGTGGSAIGGFGGSPGTSYNTGGASMGSNGANGYPGADGVDGTYGTDNVTAITNNASSIAHDYA